MMIWTGRPRLTLVVVMRVFSYQEPWLDLEGENVFNQRYESLILIYPTMKYAKFTDGFKMHCPLYQQWKGFI